MRRTKRELVLEAARAVIQDDGVTGLTFDAVAERSGLTRAGIIYHFPSRESLLLAVHTHLAEAFEQELREALTVPFAQAGVDERLLAYVRVCAGVTTRAELLFMLDAAADEQASQIWTALNDRWLPPHTSLQTDAGALRFLIRLAADGLWMYEAASGGSLTQAERDRAASMLVSMLAQA